MKQKAQTYTRDSKRQDHGILEIFQEKSGHFGNRGIIFLNVKEILCYVLKWIVLFKWVLKKLLFLGMFDPNFDAQHYLFSRSSDLHHDLDTNAKATLTLTTITYKYLLLVNTGSI